MSKKSTAISYDEVMAELDKYRPSVNTPTIQLSEKQIRFLKKCREHKKPVTFEQMAVLWEQLGWGNLGENAMRRRYRIVQNMKQ
jgi:hypothetical protein